MNFRSFTLLFALIALCVFTYRRDIPYEIFSGFSLIMLVLLDRDNV